MSEIGEDEIRDNFLNHIRSLIDYWSKIEKDTLKQSLEGLAFSILSVLDGCSGLPGFIVAPYPHPDDKQYNIENGEDYYPENHEIDIKCDISGCLHELLHKRDGK